MKWTIIYFDDQVLNIESVQALLGHRFEVVGSSSAMDYRLLLQKHRPHAILLDVHMPVLDGYRLYQHITECDFYNGCPILFISGDQSDENKFLSHDKGGVDFLSRELKPEELEARLINKIRLFQQSSRQMVLGNLTVDFESLKVHIGERPVEVTLLEMRIISTLIRKYPETVTRSELIKKIWGEESVKPGTVNTHITNLKPKIDHWDHMIRVREDTILIQPKG